MARYFRYLIIFLFWLIFPPVPASWGGLGLPQDIEFIATFDGTPQKYVIMLPENFDLGVTHDLLIALHGHGSDRWQFVLDTRAEAQAARDWAGEHNMIFVSPDYRATTSWMGPAAEADLLQIIQDLKLQYTINRVILCGASMGGASALTFTAIHPELIAGVAAMNGTANHLEFEYFQDAIQQSFGGTKVTSPLEYKKRSAEYWPERLTMPMGMTAGGFDTIVPPQSFIRLADILTKIQKKVLLIYRPQGGHSTTYADARAILDFVLDTTTLFLPLILKQ